MKAGKWIRIGILAALVAGLLFLLMRYTKQVLKAAAPLWLRIIAAYFLLPVVSGLTKKVIKTQALLPHLH